MISNTLCSAMSCHAKFARIVLLSKGKLPVLQTQVMPTVEGYDADFLDKDGFSSEGGTDQTIIVDGTALTSGTWYIAVQNIWYVLVIVKSKFKDLNSHVCCIELVF